MTQRVPCLSPRLRPCRPRAPASLGLVLSSAERSTGEGDRPRALGTRTAWSAGRRARWAVGPTKGPVFSATLGAARVPAPHSAWGGCAPHERSEGRGHGHSRSPPHMPPGTGSTVCPLACPRETRSPLGTHARPAVWEPDPRAGDSTPSRTPLQPSPAPPNTLSLQRQHQSVVGLCEVSLSDEMSLSFARTLSLGLGGGVLTWLGLVCVWVLAPEKEPEAQRWPVTC